MEEETKLELLKLRQQIDEIDKTISELLQKRLKLAQHIGSIKSKLNLPVCDAARESAVLANVYNPDDEIGLNKSIAKIYKTILEESLQIQTSSREEEHHMLSK